MEEEPDRIKHNCPNCGAEVYWHPEWIQHKTTCDQCPSIPESTGMIDVIVWIVDYWRYLLIFGGIIFTISLVRITDVLGRLIHPAIAGLFYIMLGDGCYPRA